jgi:hypothetical protein
MICKLNHCPDPACPGHGETKAARQNNLYI